MLANKENWMHRKGGEHQVADGQNHAERRIKMMTSAIFGQVIILIVFIPILSLQGVEGKMFRPMALALGFAIIGAMFLCLTWLPVAASMFLKPQEPGKKIFQKRVFRFLLSTYKPVMNWSCDHKAPVLGVSFSTLILAFIIFGRMGGEFVPNARWRRFCLFSRCSKPNFAFQNRGTDHADGEIFTKDKFPEVEK